MLYDVRVKLQILPSVSVSVGHPPFFSSFIKRRRLKSYTLSHEYQILTPFLTKRYPYYSFGFSRLLVGFKLNPVVLFFKEE